ncbi:site-specific integrase [Arthrobacter sp. Y81]|uniref:tyrosine-type recombinase/integrase n=1 Tax=Arthrobacter sp. Y81 TaxID=2058897 RepID=UPI000CE2E8F7|nr:site-specific integrase [Arthrobacter sp. Y81]
MTGSEQLVAPPVVSDAAGPTVGQTGAQLMAAFPARGVDPSWPWTCDDRSAVLARVLAAPFRLENPDSQRTRRTGVLAVLGWLSDFPGGNWQQRWQSSGAEAASDWRDLFIGEAAGRWRNAPGEPAHHLSIGLMVLICADVIRPGLDWLLRFAPARRALATEMARTRDSKAFAVLNQACTDAHVGLQTSQQALTRIAVIMAAKGGPVSSVRVGDCVELLATVTGIGTATRLQTNARSPLFYQLLRQHGVLGEDAPAAIEMFSGNGQPTCEQLIDRYNIKCRPVRDVLVGYLRERQMAMDFSSLQRTAYLLGKLFWADLEAHHPGIDSLKFSREVAASWKKRVMTRSRTSTSPSGEQIQKTSARLDGRSVFSSVRAFYLDLAEWADDDPARWGPWAVRCPVSATDVSHKKDRLARKSRTDQRTRERLPVLPALVSWVQAERARTSDLLVAAERTAPGELFTTAGQTLRRTAMKTGTIARVWAEDPEGGPRRDLTFEEHRGFWTWAMIEVLRHTGIRIEELGELSHHSLIQYRLPDTGALVPLLQIAPSKTDAERILVISPELADVLSQIVSRIRSGQPHVPPVVSYDKNERVYNPPLPLLFQWRRRLDNRAVSETVLRQYLDHALQELGIKDGGGSPMRYTFHDFRRIFITDAVMHGMPPHIAQLVAGHRDINTTMGYKAVYPEEVINGHREFIARRRALRPSQEYRTPTDAEWAEFIGHFEHRKVSVGDCGRSYDTPCIHEHSCLRCPLLRPDPTARPRLAQIRDNLIERIAEAESHRWLGEAEGLKVSLAGARAKLAEMDQITQRRNTTQLGMPTFTQAAGRTNISPPDPRNGQ